MASSPKEWLKTIGAIAAILVALVQIVQYITTARAELTATYYAAPFTIPSTLRERGALDSAIVELHKTAKRLYYAYHDHLTPSERLAGIPDSLKRPDMPHAYFYGNRIEPFARQYDTFGTLHVKNEGDKTLNLEVLHSKAAYYEFKDSKGHLQEGASASRFSIGELVSGESRDIQLWGNENYEGNTITVTYFDGKVQTAHTEIVTGLLAWFAENTGFFKIIVYSLAASAAMLLVSSYLGRLWPHQPEE